MTGSVFTDILSQRGQYLQPTPLTVSKLNAVFHIASLKDIHYFLARNIPILESAL